ncbi:MAG: PRC-barrel domain-containing protein [Atopobiaceae bacterium]|nr:PRC-barrel domain-containing protein [Atopobiaceae bacterium]
MPQLYMAELVGRRVFKQLPEDKRFKKDGTPRKAPRFGKVHQAVFSPDGLTLVGFTVSRPDMVGVVKRDDEFITLADFAIEEDGLHLTGSPRAATTASIAKLGIDWDNCIIWSDMDVRTVSGKVLGRVSDVRFDSETGRVSFIRVSGGGLSDQLVGVIELPSGLLVGYERGCMVVEDRVVDLGFTGGLAGKAGELKAKASEKMSEVGEKAAEVGQAGVEGAARFLGRQFARTKDMFSDFKKEFDEASK